MDEYETLAEPFVAHYATLRGALRYAVVSEQLDEHVSSSRPLTVVDVGGGAGHQTFRLARQGHRVTLVDPSAEMRRRARVGIGAESRDVQDRVRVVAATATEAPHALGRRGFEVVLCHAVLPYVDNPDEVVASVADLAAPGGLVSIVFKNAAALAMRPAPEGRWGDAVLAFDATADVGGLGVTTRAHTRAEVDGWCRTAGLVPRAWFGIRVMTDHLHDAPAARLQQILPVEAEASRRDPYRGLGRLIHAVYRHESRGGPQSQTR